MLELLKERLGDQEEYLELTETERMAISVRHISRLTGSVFRYYSSGGAL
jgi:hypothetical protein